MIAYGVFLSAQWWPYENHSLEKESEAPVSVYNAYL